MVAEIIEEPKPFNALSETCADTKVPKAHRTLRNESPVLMMWGWAKSFWIVTAFSLTSAD
jgi:hypothetical protein